MQRKAEFFIVGAPKAGTTALYYFLSQHRDIFMPASKENLYFVDDEIFAQGESYLEPFYHEAAGEQLLGGAHAGLMFFPYAVRRLHAYNGAMKLLAVLRNPIDRAYSAYWFARRNGTESAPTFEEALSKEDKRLGLTYREQMELGYLAQGRYARQIEDCMDAFGRERVYVALNEDLEERPEATVQAVLGWLGVAPDLSGMHLRERVNPAGIPRSRLLHELLQGYDSPLRRWSRRTVPRRLRYQLRTRLIGPIMKRNLRTVRYPPMNPETRQRLAAYFRPYNQCVARLIGRSLDHWN